jgi:serine/threonine protein kinase
MEPNRWQRIQTIANQAFELADEAQSQFIIDACDGDEDLLQEVLSIVQADHKAQALFDELAKPEAMEPTVTVFDAAKALKHYRIVRKIGVGGMGVVYEAFDERLERPVAIKFLRPNLERQESVRRRFVHEARAISRLDHPAICRIYDIGETDADQLYFVMPFYQGEVLGSRIERGTIPLPAAAGWAAQIADGLHYAHQRGILHRDIKPGNILIDPDGGAKILDFGIAKIVGEDLTATGAILGTAAYVSPEQALGQKVDARSDIWSLGGLLYELFTGRQAFTGDNPRAIFKAILSKEQPPLQPYLAPVPEAMETLMRRSLARDPAERYPSMSAMRADILRLQAELEQPSSGHAAARTVLSQHSPTRPESEQRVTTGGYRHKTRGETFAILNPVQNEQLQRALANYAGPLAKILIRRAQKAAEDIPGLIDTLAESISDQHERASFRLKMEELL